MPTLSIAKRMKREPEKVVDIETLIVENWLSAKSTLKIAGEIADKTEAEMLAALGDAEAGRCELGLVTYYEQEQKRIDSRRLKEEKPEIAAEYLKILRFRVARLKKPKKPKYYKEP